MAVKKRGRRRLKRKSGPKVKRAGARKRRRKATGAAAAPKRRRRVKRRRVAATRTRRVRVRSAPRRRRKRARRSNPFAARASAMNPRRSKRRSSVRRRSRRNPGIPMWAAIGLAGLLGLGGFALSGAGSFALTQRIDPSKATLERNRYIAGGVTAVAGLALALLGKPSPGRQLMGAGLFAGGLVGTVGTDAYLALGKVLDKDETKKIAGLFTASGQQQLMGMGGVYQDGQQQMQAVDEEGQYRSDLRPRYGYGYG